MVKIIKNDKEYKSALAEVETLIESDPQAGTEDGDRLELLALLISTYEDTRYPIEMPSPIEAIKFRMEQLGLSQKDLVPYIGSRSKVSEILTGKRSLSLKMIRMLNSGLGIDAEVLLKENDLDSYQQSSVLDWSKFPISSMIKMGWVINPFKSLAEAKIYAEEILSGSINAVDHQPALYRKNVRSSATLDTYALIAWRAKVLEIANNNRLQDAYGKEAVNLSFIKEIVRLSYFSEGPHLAKEFLKKNGIHFIYLPQLPKTHLDGAAMISNDGKPIVALTLRYNRLDNFWFSLCHELAHISLHLSEARQDIFFDDLDVKSSNKAEKEADKMANEALISKKDWEKSKLKEDHKTRRVLEFSNKLKISPAIVAGRIRYLNNNYRILARLVGHAEVRKQFENNQAKSLFRN